jgi:predicted MFS family arabinose efflux permease
MSRPQQASASHALSYAGLLALPGARRAFGAAAVARLSFGMAGLSLLLVIHQATGSFAAAGAASGAYAAGTLTAPVKARLMDRRGQRAVMPVLGAGAAAALLAMALLAGGGCRNPLAYIALCILGGALIPPVGAAMRANWAALTSGQDTERAYSLDAATEETLFTAGPLLAGVLVTAASPVLPLLVTAIALAAGCTLLGACGTSGASRSGSRERQHLAGPLAVPGFRVLLAMVLATSLGLGAIDVTITARAVHAHHPGAAGYILAALSLGSTAGGLAWGKLEHRARAATQLAALLALLAAGVALTAITPDLLLAGLVLALTGTVLAPSAVVSYVTGERLAGGGTEPSTWINTLWNAGVAAGSALTGLAVDRAGPAVPMLAGAVILAGAALAALACRNVLDERTPDKSRSMIVALARPPASHIV